MPPIKCEINLILTWSAICSVTAGTAAYQVLIFAITDIRLYVPYVT